MNEGFRDFLTAGQHNLSIQRCFCLIMKCMYFIFIGLASASFLNFETHELFYLLNKNSKLKIQPFD